MKLPVALAFVSLCPLIAQTQAPLTPEAARALAARAYNFAYPLVLTEFTRRNAVGPSGGAVNRLVHAAAFPGAGPANVIRPNADTLYSSAWIDLTAEPVLLRVPDTNSRYYLMQFMDAWTETFSVPGKRTTGTGEGWFALTGPGWSGRLPAGVQRIEAPTNTVWLIGRTQTNGPADYDAVHQIQRGYRLMPLSRYPDGVPPLPVPPGARRGGITAEMTPPRQIERLSVAEFFSTFARLLIANPPHPADAPLMSEIARLGILPGKPLDVAALTPELQKAMEEGAASASASLNSLASVRRPPRPGSGNWTGGSSDGARAVVGRYGTNYAARAAVARAGLGANPPEDAVYLNCALDGGGEPLDGNRAYRIHFSRERLPPVKAFWSITLYGKDGFFAANSISRFAIGDRDPLQFNADGSLDIYISHAEPEASRQPNWLPAPEAPFDLSFRLYWPGEEVLSGQWQPPAVTRQ